MTLSTRSKVLLGLFVLLTLTIGVYAVTGSDAVEHRRTHRR